MPTNESIEHHFIFEKDDLPNNKVLPLILYKGVADFGDKEPESVFEEVFTRNNWGNGWRSGHPDGIFSFHHYHSDAHEVVGIARGTATIQFGGPTGPIVEVRAGDAAVIPAGVAHCRLDSIPGLSVVGAYPPDQGPDVCVATEDDEQKAYTNQDAKTCGIQRFRKEEKESVHARIADTPLPEIDPIMGASGPITKLWLDK
ncbi:MAG: cupin [Pseudomonadota bacterium]|nr:cupin [Pseudomonadota bacterium]